LKFEPGLKMHELSIAMSIVEMAEEESGRHGSARILSVHMRLGKLSGVVREALLSSYEMACEATVLEGSRLVIEEVPVEIFCSKCATRRPLQTIQLFCCPVCGTPAMDVVQGKELEVIALEFE
jgi:hydrogenase nickel incorporation protein HypA/HybF